MSGHPGSCTCAVCEGPVTGTLRDGPVQASFGVPHHPGRIHAPPDARRGVPGHHRHRRLRCCATRLGRLYYGAADPKSGGVEHGARVFSHAQAHHCPEIYPGIAEAEAAGLLTRFFADRR